MQTAQAIKLEESLNSLIASSEATVKKAARARRKSSEVIALATTRIERAQELDAAITRPDNT